MSSSTTESELAGVNVQLLVPLVRDLVGLIGIINTLTLLEARGGIPLRIPVHADRDTANVLKAILPLEDVIKLCDKWPGQWLNPPKPDRILRQIRDYYLRHDREQLTAPAVALKYKLTRRQVINICNYDDYKVIKPKPVDDRQVDLFKIEQEE
ncbi:MAG: hypothetical protein ACXW1U_14500 [Methylobacter sp.]